MDTTYRKARTITVKKNRLFNDIDILAHAYSEVGGASEDLRRSDRIAVDSLDTLGEHIITRLCDHRANDIRQHLFKFIGVTSTPAVDSGSDAISTSDYTYSLLLPTDAEDDTLAPIADLIHDYIVNGALADWYAKIGSPNTELLNLRVKEDIARIRELIFHRPFPA